MAQEKRKQRGRGKTGRRCVSAPRKSDVRPRRDEIHSVMFLSDGKPVGPESDATSLDTPQAVTPTLADPGEEQGEEHALHPSPLVHFAKVSSEQAGRLTE